MDWINLPHMRAHVKTEMNPRVPKMAGYFLTI
jgi:hypothetical protein